MKTTNQTPKHAIRITTPSDTKREVDPRLHFNTHRMLSEYKGILKPDKFLINQNNSQKVISNPADSESDTAILFIESPASKSPIFLAAIRCYTQLPCGGLAFHSGRVLGDSARSRLMITRAAPGALIATTDTGNGDGPGLWRYFKIGEEFELLPVSTGGRRLTNDEIKDLFRQTKPRFVARLALRDDDLARIFADTSLSPWIRSILDTQLSFWNKHHAETYYKFTPWPVQGEEFVRCIKAAPFWALARWMDQLFPHQINYCIQRSPAGAVAFAIDRVPKPRRRELLFNHPGEAILFANEKLTESELMGCVKMKPHVAAEARRIFPPDLRSKVLISVTEHARFTSESVPHGLESDLLESIGEFPNEWFSHFGGSFSSMIDSIQCNLSIFPNERTLLKLYQKLPPNARESFHEFVPSRI